MVQRTELMLSERQKMLGGLLYDPLDPELVVARARARDLCHVLNASREGEQDERRQVLRELFSTGGDTVWMQPPFFCDYGCNIELGQRVFFNFNCVVLDVCRVRIGDPYRFTPPYIPSMPCYANNRNSESLWTLVPTSGLAAERSSCLASESVHNPSLGPEVS